VLLQELQHVSAIYKEGNGGVFDRAS